MKLLQQNINQSEIGIGLFLLTLNRYMPFWESALTKHRTPSQLFFKDNIFIKCVLIAAFQSLMEAVSSINSLLYDKVQEYPCVKIFPGTYFLSSLIV